MDRGVVPLSSFVEVFIEVQDVNDNAPQTLEPVYYPSVMESSPKDVSIIQINAVDPDAKASDKLSYRITSGNPQGFFAINAKTGKMAVPVMEVHVTTNCFHSAWGTQALVVEQISITDKKCPTTPRFQKLSKVACFSGRLSIQCYHDLMKSNCAAHFCHKKECQTLKHDKYKFIFRCHMHLP